MKGHGLLEVGKRLHYFSTILSSIESTKKSFHIYKYIYLYNIMILI